MKGAQHPCVNECMSRQAGEEEFTGSNAPSAASVVHTAGLSALGPMRHLNVMNMGETRASHGTSRWYQHGCDQSFAWYQQVHQPRMQHLMARQASGVTWGRTARTRFSANTTPAPHEANTTHIDVAGYFREGKLIGPSGQVQVSHCILCHAISITRVLGCHQLVQDTGSDKRHTIVCGWQ